MTRENERRARELMLSYDTGTTPSITHAIAKALDEAEARGRPQWRPVSENPPIAGWYATARSVSGMIAFGFSYYDGKEGGELSDVTHWQPLPEPPTPTTEEG